MRGKDGTAHLLYIPFGKIVLIDGRKIHAGGFKTRDAAFGNFRLQVYFYFGKKGVRTQMNIYHHESGSEEGRSYMNDNGQPVANCLGDKKWISKVFDVLKN